MLSAKYPRPGAYHSRKRVRGSGPSAQIAAFNGRNNPDHFFWGEIAQQLGKADQFRGFWNGGPKAPDEKDWLQLFEDTDPVLILLDEMPPYLH
jgi:hypothetical protein